MNTKDSSNVLMSMFRQSRGQSQVLYNPETSSIHKSNTKQPPTTKGYPTQKKKDDYQKFLDKYNDLENEVDNLNSRDFVYYFRYAAEQVGVKYVIANLMRDLGCMKKALDNYERRELCLMIEFLFHSEQDYLEKNNISPTILISAWCNTIYADSILWSEDKYIPRSKQVPKKKPTLTASREWTNTEETKSIVGKWRK